MKKFLAVLITICMLFMLIPATNIFVSAATSGIYTYSVSNGKVTITGCNKYASGDITIPSTLGGYPVTSIGNYAFQGCSSLTSITIPDSVTSIGGAVFLSCSSLTSITIPASVTSIGRDAFNGCKNLQYNIYDNAKYLGNETNPYLALIETTSDSITSCDINCNTKIIGDSAFSDCSSLTSITIPDSVTSIGGAVFLSCSSLTSITIPASVISIGSLAFAGCSSLTSITIPASVRSIENYAFNSCYNLQYNIYDNAKYLGNETNPYLALIRTTSNSITSCDINSNTKIICGSAFRGCSSLTSITIPDSVTSISSQAFWGCLSLTSITIPDSVTSIGDYAFYYCSSLTSVTIPASVTSIGYYAFYPCKSLTSITIPDSVTSIGGSAFRGCSSLTSITIPDSVTSIGNYAFRGCSSLTSITIPASVTSIGYYAFESCSSLNKVIYCGTVEQKSIIDIDDGNDKLINATWKYHEFDTPFSTTCNICGYVVNSEPLTGLQTIKGKLYCFDDNGIQQTGLVEINGYLYYFLKNSSRNGEFYAGRVTENGKTYDFTNGPISVSDGWHTENGKTYYSKNGANVTGVQTIGGKVYGFDDKGVQLYGFNVIDNRLYYFRTVSGAGGSAYTGRGKYEGKIYNLTENGVNINDGWYTEGGNTYYSKNGANLTGVQTIGGKVYGFDEKGVQLYGFNVIGGRLYYFRTVAGVGGSAYTGRGKYEGKIYNLTENGVNINDGWNNDKSMYLVEGVACKGLTEIEGKTYYFNNDGIKQDGLINIDGYLYYFLTNANHYGDFYLGRVTTGGHTYDFRSGPIKVN